jgi:hypothetical protein
LAHIRDRFLRFGRVISGEDLWPAYKYTPDDRVALDQMSEREEPDLDQVRDAMRDHDERLREERPDEEREDEAAQDRAAGEQPMEEDDSGEDA